MSRPASPTAREADVLARATRFAAVRGRNPATRTRVEVATIDLAREEARKHGDGRTMIYAITDDGASAHIENA